MGFQY